jgi:hypothetical protein
VDRVWLLINGRPHPEHDYARSRQPEKFSDGVVKFDQVLELSLPGDAHVIAVAAGERHSIARIYGPACADHHPAAVANPIFVDVDGGGFTPNKDTLDHPLPVKGER